eukprot:scaffold113954_cov68-Phaeocystis_antarctica.AAC.2
MRARPFCYRYNSTHLPSLHRALASLGTSISLAYRALASLASGTLWFEDLVCPASDDPRSLPPRPCTCSPPHWAFPHCNYGTGIPFFFSFSFCVSSLAPGWPDGEFPGALAIRIGRDSVPLLGRGCKPMDQAQKYVGPGLPEDFCVCAAAAMSRLSPSASPERARCA